MDLEKAIAFCSLMVLAGAVANVGSRRVRTGIALYAFQSVFLAAIAALTAYRLDHPHIYVAAVLSLVVKAFGVPQVMLYILRKIEVKRELESFLGVPSSMIVAALLVATGYYVTYDALGGAGLAQLSSTLLGVSISNVLIGFFLMINRKKAISQVIGLSVMENGLFLAAIALTSGMPLVIEIGVFFELLMGAMLMGILIFKIKESFQSIDVHAMRTLRDT